MVEKSVGLTALNELYQSRITSFLSEKRILEVRSFRIAAARLILFVLTAVFVYLSVKLRSSLLLLVPVALLAGFLYLIRRATIIRKQISYLQMLIDINLDEIKALGGDQSPFDPGTGFIDFHHEYSYDLDIFGEHSLYRLVNRTATPLGRKNLAARLLDPGTDPVIIRERQQAVRELKDKLGWRQDFLATARESDWERQPERQISAWLDAPDRFSKNYFYRILVVANSALSVILAILYLLPVIFPAVFTFTIPPTVFIYFLLPISLIISRTRMINQEQQKLERLLDLFRKYGGLLELIEKEEFAAPYLLRLKDKLKHGDELASRIMTRLTGILWGLEVRGNLIVSFFLNAFFLWDILLMIKLEKWRRNYRDSFGKWIGAIAEFETLNSFANLSFNRPDLTWPEIREGKFSMEIRNGGHPLINPAKRVDNSLNFDGDGRIYLITGANMAGKSTLLRMAGVNMILAMAGGPVCAAHFSMVPVRIHTSVRTNDSLGDDESYFYAELKKLSSIITRLEQDGPLFVIIDEMLKGTNSRDKHTGSAALIHRLIGLGASGLVATHDVELGELEKVFEGRLVNRCFEVITDSGQLKFDYLLYPGVSKNLNATFLMRKMGIIRE
jgi:ABC-type multidrug transport system fused ATPase/permease subunit